MEMINTRCHNWQQQLKFSWDLNQHSIGSRVMMIPKKNRKSQVWLKHVWCTQTVPRHLLICTQTVPRHLEKCTQTSPKHQGICTLTATNQKLLQKNPPLESKFNPYNLNPQNHHSIPYWCQSNSKSFNLKVLNSINFFKLLLKATNLRVGHPMSP